LGAEHSLGDGGAGAGQRQIGHRDVRILHGQRQRGAGLVTVERAVAALLNHSALWRCQFASVSARLAGAPPYSRRGSPKLRSGAAELAAPERAVVQQCLPPLALQLPDPTALALAVQYPHIAVTYLPLACTGATNRRGNVRHPARRECCRRKTPPAAPAPSTPSSPNCAKRLPPRKRRQPDRRLDLVLLSVGANDIDFSGLVGRRDRRQRHRAHAVSARAADRIGRRFPRGGLAATCRKAFCQSCGEALKPLVGNLQRVVYVSMQPDACQMARPAPAAAPASIFIPRSMPSRGAFNSVSELCQSEFLAAAQGDRDLRRRVDVPRSAARPHDVCRCA